MANKLNAVSRQIAEQKPTGNAALDETLGNLAVNVLSTAAGGVVGGAQGAQAAYNVDRFNRQVHPEEKGLAKKLTALAKEKGLPYSELQAFIANNTTANGVTYEATTTGSNPGLFRLPDFVNFQVDYFVGSAWGTFTREGKSYFGYGVNMALPNPVQASTSITAGWLNKPTVAPGKIDTFMQGYGGGATGAYGLFGGGMMYSPGNGSATLIGIGGGVNAGKMPNVRGVGGGYAVEQGKTGIEW
jgi:hypothetical protein